MRQFDPQERADKIDGLTARYRQGEISTAVFGASLKAAGVSKGEIAWMTHENGQAFVNSLPFKRGHVS